MVNDHAAHLDVARQAVVIEGLTTTNVDVVREAKHWPEGRRDPLVNDPDCLDGADVTSFVEEALVIGSRALAATAQTSDTRAVEQMLRDVGDRTTDATRQAAELTGRTVRDASESVARVADEAKKAITEADQRNRQEITTAVGTATQELTAAMQRLVGGENPELLRHLQPLLDRFGTTVEKTMSTSAGELLAKATKQLDPADPTSPLAKHTATLTAQQEALAKRIETQHGELAAKVDELATALKVREAKASLTRVTPLKGGSFEDQIHTLMHDIAAGLGDEYEKTATTLGLTRSRKGDGVLRAQSAAVVVEVTDSVRTGWTAYFDDAERNRGAEAALGVVRTPEQNGGHTVRVLGPRRIVLAHDPEDGDPELLRTAVMLLRTIALAASARTGASELATAEERILDAVVQLEKLDGIKKLSTGIQKSAGKIDGECTAIATSVQRLLDEALTALGGAGAPAAGKPEVA